MGGNRRLPLPGSESRRGAERERTPASRRKQRSAASAHRTRRRGSLPLGPLHFSEHGRRSRSLARSEGINDVPGASSLCRGVIWLDASFASLDTATANV